MQWGKTRDAPPRTSKPTMGSCFSHYRSVDESSASDEAQYVLTPEISSDLHSDEPALEGRVSVKLASLKSNTGSKARLISENPQQSHFSANPALDAGAMDKNQFYTLRQLRPRGIQVQLDISYRSVSTISPQKQLLWNTTFNTKTKVSLYTGIPPWRA